VSHYWPIGDNTVTDTITGKTAASKSPQFSLDRYDVLNGAAWVDSDDSAWQLPAGAYFNGDTTVTMWVKKIKCGGGDSLDLGAYGKQLNFIHRDLTNS
jgi:hypothetical protein